MFWLWFIGLYIAGAIVAGKFYVWLDMDEDDTLTICIVLWPALFPITLALVVIGFLIHAILTIVKR